MVATAHPVSRNHHRIKKGQLRFPARHGFLLFRKWITPENNPKLIPLACY
jgi:hypothetical protein